MREIRWKRIRAIAKSMNRGASIVEACDAAKLNRITFWRWRKSDPKLSAFVQRLQDNQVEVVEGALFKRACGYRYEETTEEKEVDTAQKGKKVVKVVTKEIVPDSTACMFFLMNRAPDRWADKRAIVNNTILNKVETNNGLKNLTESELRSVVAIGQRLGIESNPLS